MTDTMETPHHLMANKEDVGSLASTDCRPQGKLHICSCTWVGGTEDCRDTEGVQGEVRKKVEGLTPPEEQSQLHLASLGGTETQEIIPHWGCVGQQGKSAPGLEHTEDSVGSSPAVTPALGTGKPRG